MHTHPLKLAWRGQERLSKVFWIYNVAVSTALSQIAGNILKESLLFALLLLAIAVPYGIWITVAVWRCAWNVNHKFWGVLARLWVIGQIVITLVVVWAAIGVLIEKPEPAQQASSAPAKAAVPATLTIPRQDRRDRSDAPLRTGPIHLPSDPPDHVPAMDQKPHSIEGCTQKFNDVYRQKGWNPESYANIRDAYVPKCAAGILKPMEEL